MSRVYSYIVWHVYIVILYVLYDDVCMYKSSQIKCLLFTICNLCLRFDVHSSMAQGYCYNAIYSYVQQNE